MSEMYIEELSIRNFKCFKQFDLKLNKNLNILVGDNESGKSTILEALHLALTGLFHGKYLKHELTQYLFNNEVVAKYLENINDPEHQLVAELPFILIEIYFSGEGLALFEGDGNNNRKHRCGISYKIAFDDKHKKAYERLIEIGEIKTIPIEYYDVFWTSFSRENITARTIPIKSAFIDSTASRYQNGSDIYISRIVKDHLELDDIVHVAQAHRKMKDKFMNDDSIVGINNKIKNAANISNKEIKLSVELSSKNAWENSLITYLDDVPFHHIGKGEQCVVKTKLALSHNKVEEANILLIEEPESHLSHSKLSQLINDIKESNDEKQILISTHSSFVANKLDLKNLVLLNDKKNIKFDDLSEDTRHFFEKLSGYDTLRLILCKKVILAEGDSDELIVQKAFILNNNGKLPIQEETDIISVGTSFLRFLEIAKKLNKSVVVVTDNDGKPESLAEKYAGYNDKNIKICFDPDVEHGELQVSSGKEFNYNTLEPKLVKANNYDLALFNRIFSTHYTEIDDLHMYMRNNKTDCALKIFNNKTEEINFPRYILDAID